MKRYIIPIFIPHYGCRHNCIFCNQQKITGKDTPVKSLEVQGIIDEQLARISEERHVEVAFYGGSFTALPLKVQADLLKPAYQAFINRRIQGIRLSTRPDCITGDIVRHLAEWGVSTIELGVQSLDDRVLQASGRGHTAGNVVEAVPLIKKSGILCGLQLMPGLPLEDWKSLIHTARGVLRLAPDFVRIYPTLVIEDTPLAGQYRKGSYRALSLADGIRRGAYLKLLFEQHNIPTIRTGLQATEELDKGNVIVAGPYHPAFGELVESYLFYIMLVRFIEFLSPIARQDSIIIHHHPQDTSKLRGIHSSNIKEIKNTYGLTRLILKQDGVNKDQIEIEYNNLCYVFNKKMIFSL